MAICNDLQNIDKSSTFSNPKQKGGAFGYLRPIASFLFSDSFSTLKGQMCYMTEKDGEIIGCEIKKKDEDRKGKCEENG